MVSITKLNNPSMMKLLDVPAISIFTNTKQELLIKLRVDTKKYETWKDRQDEEAELEDGFRENAYAAVANDILLYAFGLTGGMPERKGSREANMADYFWKEQDVAKPTTKEGLLATEQLAKYLIYESDNSYAVACEVYGDNTELFPETVTIRFQVAKPLNDNWERLLETRLNKLFAPENQDMKYKHWTTRMYDLADIMLGEYTD